MAMKMAGEVTLPAGRETVWQKLNDPAVLKACIPGCQSLEATPEGGFAAVAKIKVGPMSATFKGAVTLSDLDPPNGYKISGSGEGGIAGFAKGRRSGEADRRIRWRHASVGMTSRPISAASSHS
ncbi:MAG: carbon monoxide dehydrogenase [Xanthobacteraceae bacterium]|jgi:carbon monoxide dehydrogenase subunit G|nr:carbon monoxide dehydrogenase [Xanthobacteraceae bacterium]